MFRQPRQRGIGILLRYNGYEKTVSKGYFQTTNNRMELRAVIEALAMLKEPCKVQLNSDSQYMKNGIKNGFLTGRKMTGKPAIKSQLKIKIYGLL